MRKLVMLSPGTFVSEQTELEVGRCTPEQAVEICKTIVERHGSRPYAFYFVDGAERSPTYYLGGRVRTYDQVVADNLPNEETLRWNMKVNGYTRILETNNSYRHTAVLKEGDVVLDVVL